MKRLDLYIESHRDELDQFEPEEGHFIRFKEKLSKSKPSLIVWILRFAAIFLAAAFISVNLYISNSVSEENLPSELKETAYFYKQRSEILLTDIEKNKNINNSQKQIILKDIRSFDKEYTILLKELTRFPGDERLVNAFIDYHRSKTEFLECILNQITATNLIAI